MLLMFLESSQKARTKTILGLSVYQINIRDTKGSFCPWQSFTHPTTPSPHLIVWGGGLLLCPHNVVVEGERMARGRKIHVMYLSFLFIS
jgi:hypothetical protein